MNKNIAVVAEAAAYAREAGRTFVEPVYCRSRVRPPFDGPEVVGAAFARADGVDYDPFASRYERAVDACVEINQCVGCTRQFFT